MPYQRCYSRINWENEPSTETPLNDVNLNAMDSAIYELDGRTVELESRVTNLEGYETAAAQSATAAANSATQAASSSTSAGSFATLAESYAKGGTNTRTGEDTDNAKYYMEQARIAAQQASGCKYVVFNTPADVDTSILEDREMVVILHD